jgi:hypothetical protein
VGRLRPIAMNVLGVRWDTSTVEVSPLRGAAVSKLMDSYRGQMNVDDGRTLRIDGPIEKDLSGALSSNASRQ